MYENQITPIIHAAKFGSLLELPNLYLKLEGENPTGSHKDRASYAMIQKALTEGKQEITVATCGNYGASIAYFAQKAQVKAKIFIPTSFESPRVQEIIQHGAEVIRLPISYEECAVESIAYAKEQGAFDANPGGAHTSDLFNAYGQIFNEVMKQLPKVEAFAIPTSNGTTLVGVAKEMQQSKAGHPVLVASSVTQNPIIASVNGKKGYTPLPKELLIETEVNEPLINWDSLDGREAYAALTQTKSFACGFTDDILVSLAEDLYETEKLSYIPASLAGVAALRKLTSEGKMKKEAVLCALLTCKEGD